jgi:hypothetical protein
MKHVPKTIQPGETFVAAWFTPRSGKETHDQP